jgi:glycosyltransferase involved in cell wall biosynthesis
VSAPLFSVIIPTRNRGHLLRFALRCVLDQRCGDLEVIVSDNDSADSTREVVSEFSDPRIRYVKTPKTLHMPDSWEFALSHATGRYVTFVSDDDGVSPRLLEMIHGAVTQSGLDIVAWPFGGNYHHDTCDEVELRNTLAFEPMKGRSEEVTSRSVIADLSAVRFTHKLPRLINSCASASVLADVRQSFGRVFFPACPDYSSGLAQLAVRPALAYVHDLVLIWGIGKESIGYSQTKGGQASKDFLRELRDDNADRTRYVPLQVYTAMNFAIDSLLHVKHLAGDRLAELNIDPLGYYACVARELVALERNGLDVSAGFDEMRKALAKESPRVRLAITQQFCLVPGGRMLRTAQEAARSALSSLKHRWLGPGHHPSALAQFKGDANGFSNIYEAVARLDELSAPLTGRAAG